MGRTVEEQIASIDKVLEGLEHQVKRPPKIDPEAHKVVKELRREINQMWEVLSRIADALGLVIRKDEIVIQKKQSPAKKVVENPLLDGLTVKRSDFDEG